MKSKGMYLVLVAVLLTATITAIGMNMEQVVPYIQCLYFILMILKDIGSGGNKKEQTKIPFARH